MINIKAFYKGRLVAEETCPETIKTEKDAKTRIINTLYWNVISCTVASTKNWYNDFEYKIEHIKI